MRADRLAVPRRASRASLVTWVWGAFAVALPASAFESWRPELLGMNLHPAYYLMVAGLPIVFIASGLAGARMAMRIAICAGVFTLVGATSALARGAAPPTDDVVKWLAFFGTAVLVAITVRTEHDVRRILAITTASIAALCFYGLYLYYTQNLLWVNPFEGMASRNALSNWTAGLFVFAFYFALRARLTTKVLWLALLAVMLLAQVYTANRSSWAVIALSVAGVVAIVRDAQLKVQGIAVAGLCMLALASGMFVETADLLAIRIDAVSGENIGVTAEDRLTHVSKTVDVFADYPLLGVGLGQYRFVEPESDFSHNVYLTIVSETGLVGSLAVLILVLSILSTARYALRRAKFADEPRTTEGVLVVMLAAAMCLFRGLTSHEIQFMPVTGLLLGLFAAYIDLAATDPGRALVPAKAGPAAAQPGVRPAVSTGLAR